MINKIGLMENCPRCCSRDVGGSQNKAYCYKCGYEIQGASTKDAVEKWNNKSKSSLNRIGGAE